LTQAEAAALIQSSPVQPGGGHTAETAGALWAEMGLQVTSWRPGRFPVQISVFNVFHQ